MQMPFDVGLYFIWLAFLVMTMTLFFLLLVLQGAFSTNCEEVYDKGSGAVFTIEELSSLVANGDLAECLIFLGKDRLSLAQAATIWSKLVQVYGQVSEIPEENLRHLGWVILGIPANDFSNLSLTDIDTVAAFGKCSNLNIDQLSNLQSAISEQWNKEPQDLTSYDLIALHQILCAFNSSSIRMIHPSSYKEASSLRKITRPIKSNSCFKPSDVSRGAANELVKLQNCPDDIIVELAKLATSLEAFGEPKLWNPIQAATVGCVMSGLQPKTIKEIPPEAFEGITADIVPCLPPFFFKVLTVEQISHLSPDAVSAMSNPQTNFLTHEQNEALQDVITNFSKGGQSSLGIPFWNFLLTSVLIVLRV